MLKLRFMVVICPKKRIPFLTVSDYSSILSNLKITGLTPSVQQERMVPFCFIQG